MTSGVTNILVGVDFSESSSRALSHALQLAEALSGRLDLVYVYDIPIVALPEMVIPSTSDVSQLSQLRKQLKEIRAQAIGNRVPSRIHLRVGDPVAGILDLCEEVRPDLIVIGSHGRGAVMRALLGSVSERLCRRSPVPVLVVPTPERKHLAAETEGQQARDEKPPAPAAAGHEIAWSCTQCGHIRSRIESADRCSRCGVEPADWNSAPMFSGPADELEASVGEIVGGDADEPRMQAASSAGLFATSPGGTEGYDVNPELRVRY